MYFWIMAVLAAVVLMSLAVLAAQWSGIMYARGKPFRWLADTSLVLVAVAALWLLWAGYAHASTLTPLAATVQAVQQAVEDECDGCVQEDEPAIEDTSDVVEPDVAISWMAVATCDNFEFPHIHSQGEGYGWCAPLDDANEQMFGWEE